MNAGRCHIMSGMNKPTKVEKKTPVLKWDKNAVFRTTRCFSPSNNGYVGGFPLGFLKYIKEHEWWGKKRAHLCSGGIDDPQAVRVDIKPETNPTHCEDAGNTSLPDNEFDCVIIDPPYSRDLAKELYGTEKHFHGIDYFTKEASRICKSGGLIITLSYQVPRRIPNCNFIAVVGVYQAIQVANMRCLTVSRKI